ncbi:MAG: hypothetical protein Kow00106_11170 [Anaerolineae bacterium]
MAEATETTGGMTPEARGGTKTEKTVPMTSGMVIRMGARTTGRMSKMRPAIGMATRMTVRMRVERKTHGCPSPI